MQIIRDISAIKPEPCVATIGFFDGVHAGHRYLIQQVKEIAAAKGLRSALVTFPVHPRKVMNATYHPELLTTPEEKINLLAGTGVDYCLMLDFTPDISRLTAKEFMTQVLKERYQVRYLVIGYDHRFGHNRSEGFEDYVRYGQSIGIDVIRAQAYTNDIRRDASQSVPVSSSLIRKLLHQGDVDIAARCLGYEYFLDGTVVGGYQVGRKIGFPTANLSVDDPDKLIPADGVYFLKIPEFDIHLNAENEPMRTMRIRYYTHNDKIGAAESIAMRPNESVFLDLWFSPEISSRLEVESEDEALTYDLKMGYLTAPSTPEGSADLVFSNGYLEGDEGRIEAVTHVIWSENPLSDISISNAPQSLSVGSSAQLEAAVTPDDYIGRVSWESSDTTVLRVLSNGKVVAVGQGEAVITASVGECTSSVTITVTGEQPGESDLTGVSLDRYTLTLYAGEEAEQLTATLKPEGTEAAIHWTSSNQTAATVSQDGKVTPLAAGVTVVTAAAGDYRASCIVTVQPERVRVTGIRFDEPTHTLMMGSTVTLQPIIAPDDATVKNLTWVSSDEQTATVSRTGIVTALSVGETTITATTVDGGYSAEIKIIVTAAAQLGDVNGDGYIDAADALLCLRASVGLITLTLEQEAAADVNHDGLVDAGDAILILRYDARLIPNLN